MDSRPIQPQPDPLSQTTQMPHLADKMAQPTNVQDGTGASRFAPKAASAKMHMNKTVQQRVLPVWELRASKPTMVVVTRREKVYCRHQWHPQLTTLPLFRVSSRQQEMKQPTETEADRILRNGVSGQACSFRVHTLRTLTPV